MGKTSQIIRPTAKGAIRFPGEDYDCAVRALANCAEITYAEAHTVFKEHGRINGKPTNSLVIDSVYRKYNIKMIACFGTTKNAEWNRQMGVKHCRGITIKNILKVITEGRFIVELRTHVFAVVDGDVIDDCEMQGGCSVTGLYKLEEI